MPSMSSIPHWSVVTFAGLNSNGWFLRRHNMGVGEHKRGGTLEFCKRATMSVTAERPQCLRTLARLVPADA